MKKKDNIHRKDEDADQICHLYNSISIASHLNYQQTVMIEEDLIWTKKFVVSNVN